VSSTPTLRRAASNWLTVGQIERLALHHGVPVEDVLLIALNRYGISSDQDRHRARLAVQLASMPQVAWQAIVPLNAEASPFQLYGQDLTVLELSSE
jgi:hypothetical protein